MLSYLNLYRFFASPFNSFFRVFFYAWTKFLQRASINYPSLNQLDDKMTSNITKNCFNILLLGETGVGKTTLINAFANYQKFPTMAEAMASDLIGLIPASFVIRDGNNVTKTVYVGNPAESKVDGESDTQDCKAYLFESKGRIIRLIDTPGIGDTRGLEKDRENAQKILAFASHYPVVHGIFILLKPNHSRLDNAFRFCVMELLCYLHQSASDNIVFVFTNARGTSYKPGDTIVPLKTLLDEIRNRNSAIDIPLNLDRTYCLDNEGFRCVAALKSTVTFTTEEVEDFGRSWKKSSDECNKLIEYIVKLKPHRVTDSLSVNEARRLIVGFSRPLGDITLHIQLNIAIAEEQRVKIENAKDDDAKLKLELMVPSVELIPVPFEKPITVCTSPGCLKVHVSNGIDMIDYVKKCHKPCHLQNVTPNLVNNPDLKHCAAMQGQNCKKCLCPWQKHMHIYYENVVLLKDESVNIVDKALVETKSELIARSKKILDELEGQRQQLEAEQEQITRVSARFAHFLKKTAITPYNDAVADYLEHLIEGEQTKNNQGATRQQILAQLEKMKLAYNSEKQILDENITAGEDIEAAITPQDIYGYCQELFNLPINGSVIHKMIIEFEQASKKEHENFTEVTFDPTKMFKATIQK